MTNNTTISNNNNTTYMDPKEKLKTLKKRKEAFNFFESAYTRYLKKVEEYCTEYDKCKPENRAFVKSRIKTLCANLSKNVEEILSLYNDPNEDLDGYSTKVKNFVLEVKKNNDEFLACFCDPENEKDASITDNTDHNIINCDNELFVLNEELNLKIGAFVKDNTKYLTRYEYDSLQDYLNNKTVIKTKEDFIKKQTHFSLIMESAQEREEKCVENDALDKKIYSYVSLPIEERENITCEKNGVKSYINWRAYDPDRFKTAYDNKDYFTINTLRKRYLTIMSMLPDEPITSSRHVMIEKANKWLTDTSYKQFYDKIAERVMGQEKLGTVLLMVYRYIKNAVEYKLNGKPFQKQNIIITAPSGCGKTETYRALKEYFKEHIPEFPILMIDTTKLTPAGIAGDDITTNLKELTEANTDGIGLVFLDEIDKKIEPLNTNSGDLNRSVQNDLLILIEGGDLYKESPLLGERSKVGNTKNTMMIGLGSFSAAREQRKKDYEVSKDSKAFGRAVLSTLLPKLSEDISKDDLDKSIDKAFAETFNEPDVFDDITREDILKAGGSSEFVGRFSLICNYKRLSFDTIKKIIDQNIERIERDFDCNIVMENGYLYKLAKEASGEFGIRHLYNTMLEAFMPAYEKLILNDPTDDAQEDNNSIIYTNDETCLPLYEYKRKKS